MPSLDLPAHGEAYRARSAGRQALPSRTVLPAADVETRALKRQATVFQSETLALTGVSADLERAPFLLLFMKWCERADDHDAQTWRSVALMGPTGVRARIIEGETVMIVTEGFGHAHFLATGLALRDVGSRVLHVALFDSPRMFTCATSSRPLRRHSLDHCARQPVKNSPTEGSCCHGRCCRSFAPIRCGCAGTAGTPVG